ncbi:MAG: hydrogenase expression/formation protein HypE [Thermoprotei archaeon]|nr:MAG: hydrogenase expression/formation protein HypE [Thermoprotei archaeon]
MKITLAHGAGGKETEDLIRNVIIPMFRYKSVTGGIGLDQMEDSAIIPIGDKRYLAITIDSYTVNPIFFPGGNIGKLAACGTINDLAVVGARPIGMLDGIVVEEGFDLDKLKRILKSFEEVLSELKIPLLGGDFKVMPRGSVDKIVISTCGLGIIEGGPILDSGARPGDKVIISGTIGDHGAVILALQSGLEIESEELSSDCQPVLKVMECALKIGEVHAAKDPTRGGLAMALNEIARKSKVTIIIDEEEIPIRESVRAYCDMLGVDPLSLACEGKVVMCVGSEVADDIVKNLHKYGYNDACIIGEVRKEKDMEGYVIIRTKVGGMRIVEPPTGEIVPRIC